MDLYPDDDDIPYVNGNPTNADDLRWAGIERAECAIVVADASATSTDPDDMDARTLMTVLAIESPNPACYTCVEVIKSDNRPHFSRAKADELVVSAEMTGALLASSAKTHGLSRLVADLLTHPEGMEFYRVEVPASLVGATVQDAVGLLKSRHDVLFVGVFGREGATVNPPADGVLAADEALLVIAPHPPTIGKQRTPPRRGTPPERGGGNHPRGRASRGVHPRPALLPGARAARSRRNQLRRQPPSTTPCAQVQDKLAVLQSFLAELETKAASTAK